MTTRSHTSVFQTRAYSLVSPDSPRRPKTREESPATTTAPRRCDRRLPRVFYLSSLSALSALKSCVAAGTYYDRRRLAGKTRIQAMLALARRRPNVLWAMLRPAPPTHLAERFRLPR
ncbi:hypothetical protein J2S94_003961 [Arthrobacter bambusae]|nr:hypothetical protein [Arthrobacter bambusae]